MLKKRYLHRNDWTRIIDRDYSVMHIDGAEFNGYIALIRMNEVKSPLLTDYFDKKICIVDQHYSWLQQLPLNETFAVTTMFDDQGEIVQWYIDITYENGIDEDGPYMLDLFLDIVVLPSGEIIEKDKDELEMALQNQWISKQQYALAYETFNSVLEHIQAGTFPYFELSMKHRKLLLETLAFQN